MITTLISLVALCLLANVIIAWAMRKAPLGYQDQMGFHLGYGEESNAD